MEARLAETLPEGEDWSYEPKWDGFRCLVFKNSAKVDLRAKSGKPLGRFFPEVIAFMASMAVEQFVLDGELVIERDGHLSFDALQMRLHPAESRIQRLATETPARFVVFDILMNGDGKVMIESPLSQRRQALQALVEQVGAIQGISAVSDDFEVVKSDGMVIGFRR